MQDAGHRKPRQVGQIQSQGAATEAQGARHRHEIGQRCTFERQRIALSQAVQVNLVPVIGRHHRKRGKAAFGHLGLQDQRQAPSLQQLQCGHGTPSFGQWLLLLAADDSEWRDQPD